MNLLKCSMVIMALFIAPQLSHGAMLSFQVDPATIDSDPADGFITGTEFSPTGSDGTVFVMTPTNNLVGGNRFLLSDANGLSFGGGSGSTLSFDFTPDKDITLNSYTLGGGGIQLGNPIFDIRQGVSVLSASNSGNTSGSFVGGPISLSSGTNYSFVVTNSGAAIQRQMATWDYTTVSSTVPEPSSMFLFAFLGVAAIYTHSRNNRVLPNGTNK